MCSISFASGFCNAIASSTEPVSRVSHCSAIVSSTGIALAWIGRTMSLDSRTQKVMLVGLFLPLASKSEERPAFIKRPMVSFERVSVHSHNDVAGTRQRHSALSQPCQ
jgi:hypothetical protein